MKKAKNKWIVQEQTDESQLLVPIVEKLKMPSQFASLLWNRGIKSAEEADKFFNPSLENLHPAEFMHDMEKAVLRIQEALEKEENILIYGDYDADGITSTTIMKEAIELIGGEPAFYLPNRFTDGYGPNLDVYKYFIEQENIQLIITVDNGISGHEAISFAQKAGVDVIVTDHHEVPEELPEAYAIVHPRHPEGAYPFGDLAGVGVAFKVATALLGEIPVEMLDLVAIGTIADLVSLTDENRSLVKLGLDVLKHSDRIGLHFLCQKAGISQEEITSENVGFGLAPRLNAIGRLGDAAPGVQLLTTFEEEEAEALATFIQEENEKRQSIVKEIIEEALEMVREMPEHQLYILAKEGWHEGVLGIVASRIVQETGKPTIVLTIDPEKQIAKGSGRSVEQVNLYEALQYGKEYFVNFGGHHMAAGMTVPLDSLHDLQEKLDEYVLSLTVDFSEGQPLLIDEVLQLEEATLPFIQKLDVLSPFGTDNPSPVFLFEQVVPKQLKQIGADKNHLKFVLEDKDSTLDSISFNIGQEIEEFSTTNYVDVVGQLSVNEWNGNKKPQLMVNDYCIKEAQLFDFRGNVQHLKSNPSSSSLYVVFQKENKKYLPTSELNQVLIVDEAVQQYQIDKLKYKNLVVVDCPREPEKLKEVVHQLQLDRIYLYGISPEQCYLNGMPTREQFTKLFNFIKTQKNVDVRYKTKEIGKFLNIEETMLIFMIQVFLELGFVIIEGGVMNRVENPENRSLNESQIFQGREAKIKAEEFILYGSMDTIKKWLS